VTRRLVLAMMLIAVTVAVTLALPMVILVANTEEAALVSELQVETLQTASLLSQQSYDKWVATVNAAPSRTGERVVVVSQLIELVADSDHSGLERAFNRPEIRQALKGKLASDVRMSETLGTELRFVAAPIVKNEVVVAAVRYSLPEELVKSAVRRTSAMLALFVLVVALIAALVAWAIASSISAPVRALADIAKRLPDDLQLRADETAGPTEVRSVAVAMNGTARRLFELVKRTERVAADASHHLRTPLTGIRLRLEAIADTATDRGSANDAEHALAEVDRLNHRIDQVLALARSDADSGTRTLVNASPIVLSRVGSFTPIAANLGVELEHDIQPDAFAMTTKGAVARIVDELLSNAQNYARARVQISLRSIDDGVLLTVDDDGPGVLPGEMDSIFGRFSRGVGAVAGGTGLGLALVRETALGCGGDAMASRSDLGGLSIKVVLPKA
jgi:two-component system OmpR family sensor kinase